MPSYTSHTPDTVHKSLIDPIIIKFTNDTAEPFSNQTKPVNEVAIMCEKLGVDVWEVIDAAATKPYGFMKFTPGPGLGGHCIPIDPQYLSWKMRTLDYNPRFINLAAEINSAMPAFVKDTVANGLNGHGKALNGSSVLILGAAYKKDIDDVRESPALDVMILLETAGAAVDFFDPYVADIIIDI